MQNIKELIGKTFVHSWGYDQTNYDFIIVIGLTKSGKSARCRRCHTECITSESTMTTNALKPTLEPFGDTFTMRIREGSDGSILLRGSYPYCCDGSMKNKMLGYFFETRPNECYQETRPEYGH